MTADGLVPDWRDVVGWAGLYLISVDGEVRSTRSGRLLTPKLSNKGYARVGLNLRRQQTWKSVHSLVLEAFVGPRPEGLVAAHLDGNRLNNHASNLRWVTQAENLAHRELHETMTQRGETHGRAKLTWPQVRQIRSTTGASKAALARQYGVTDVLIGKIVRGELWRVA